MTIRSAGDLADAYDNGRWHIQRFFKNAMANAGDGSWIDWAYASGQPGYNARVGTANTFTPEVAIRNDAIWFPDIPAGMERRLTGIGFYTSATQSNQTNVEALLYDLVGYYPLIDGDSTDLQTMDNTLTLPRYTDGVGVRAVIVNHVAPQITSGGTHTIIYADADGTERTTTFGIQNAGVNRANSRIPSAAAGASGDMFMALPGRGVRNVKSIQYATAPGGLQCIYLIKPISYVSHRAGADIQNSPVFTQKCLCAEESLALPVIPDGASLGFFLLANGSARTIGGVSGTLTFAWG